MRVVTRWWQRRSKAQRFDLYVRANLYLAFVLPPVLVGLLLAAEPQVGPGARGALTGVAAVHAVMCVVLLRAGLGHYLAGATRPVRLILAGAALTVAGVAVVTIAYPDRPPDAPDGPASLIALVLSAAFVAAQAPAVPMRLTVAVAAAAGAARFVVLRVEGAPAAEAASVAAASAALFLCIAAGFRVSAWTSRVMGELERTRQAQARLAVAEERLRFARDLHDIVGRNMSVVALKAELAAELAKRGRAEAVDEMLEVRRVAEESLADVRDVVRGYRRADLGTELAGARSLLASAGIDCRVTGDGRGLPAEAQGALGWVVREATTNVLRHSEARTCTVTLRRPDDRVVLTVENDGVADDGTAGAERVRFGSGLIGLAERIAGLGGTTVAERDRPGVFRLTVDLPVTATATPREDGS